MNYIFAILTSIILGFSGSTEVPYEAISSYFKKTDAKNIMALGKDKVSISVNGKDGVYSHSQGELILSSFFKANPPKDFKFIFKGKKQNQSTFGIATYLSEKSFRITFQFKLLKEKYSIESISIEKNN